MPRLLSTCTTHTKYTPISTTCPFSNSRAAYPQNVNPFSTNPLWNSLYFGQNPETSGEPFSYPSWKSVADTPLLTASQTPKPRQRLSIFSKPNRYPATLGEIQANFNDNVWNNRLEIDENDSLTESRSNVLADKVRWRNAAMIYSQFDPWNKGYIDIQEAIDSIRQLIRNNVPHNHIDRLVAILEDLKSLVSSRGVIERDVSINAIKKFIDESGLSCSIYGALRGSSRSLMATYNNLPTVNQGIGALPFYQADSNRQGTSLYIANKSNAHYQTTSTDCPYTQKRLKNQQKKDEIYPLGRWGPVDAPLNIHATITQLRRQETLLRITAEQDAKYQKQCPFKPDTKKKLKPRASTEVESEEPPKIEKPEGKHNLNTTESKNEDTTLVIVCPEKIVFQPDKSSRQIQKKFNSEEHEQANLESDKKKPCQTITPSYQYQILKQAADEEKADRKEWDGLIHFVMHVGEPPPAKNTSWKNSLREGQMTKHFDIENGTDLNKDIKPAIFNEYSKKLQDRPQRSHIFDNQFGWTPKMAFTKDDSALEKSSSTNNSTVRPMQFERPYNTNKKIFDFSKVYTPSTDHLSEHRKYALPVSVLKKKYDTKVDTKFKHSRAAQTRSRLQTNSSSDARDKKEVQNHEIERCSIDALLLPQKPPSDSKIQASNPRSLFGDFVSGLNHSNRGESEWVHHLRGGYLGLCPSEDINGRMATKQNNLLLPLGPMRI